MNVKIFFHYLTLFYIMKMKLIVINKNNVTIYILL